MARFGKHVVMRNNMSPEQHRKYMEYFAGELPAVTAKIDGHVRAIVEIIARFDPLTILQRGYWVSAVPYMMPREESEEKSDVIGQRMVDYIQSVIAAVLPKAIPAPPITEEAWGDLSRHVEELFDTINHNYLPSRRADWTVNGGGPPEEQTEFYARALVMWCNVTGHRYHFQEIDHLRHLITPHSDVFLRLWGIDAEGILQGFSAILNSLTRGLGEAMERMMNAYKEYLAVETITAGDEAAMERRLDTLRSEEDAHGTFGRLFGVDLFKVDQHLPKTLLDDLSWSPGECRDFIDQNPQSGWPTRIWPRTRRPFLKVNGSYFCFDVHTLFDHVYRVLERTVRAKEPAYSQSWNDRQKGVSEDLPFKFFGKLLPSAKSWRSVHYEIDELDVYGHKKWCEVDGLLACEDHLFIIEVKAGTFTAASPETNFDSHLKSIERLIFAPVDQGVRFHGWLERQGTIVLHDDRHRRIGELSRGDFAHITVCAVSLDPFTELAAKAYHLRHLVGRHKVAPFWALSVSDLMTYSDLFDNPLVFLHFVEKRNQAIASSKVVLDDELDHYGMYLEHNNYDLHAEDVAGDSHTNWTGYRAVIDKYFDNRVRHEPATLPRQEIPPFFYTIIQVLAGSRHSQRRRIASLLLDCDGETRKGIERSLLDTLKLQAESRRPRPLSVGGRNLRISFVCWQPGVIDPQTFSAAEHCQAAMLAADEPDRWLIELYFGGDQELLRANPTLFAAEKLSATERSHLRMRTEELRIQRFNQATTRGKVGRNQFCPCGSGRKYKRCCGT